MRGMPQPGDRVVQVGTGREVRRGPLALEVVERGAAIHKATELAEPGDLIVLAGKGHEKTQTIGDRTQPFDDVEAAREALARRRSRMRVG
jgi:UDP-N-acetylmuramoyl-L-alanyl-D-glutamate--2,6-diaminopimelate ligase